jgi:hypothetical protein
MVGFLSFNQNDTQWSTNFIYSAVIQPLRSRYAAVALVCFVLSQRLRGVHRADQHVQPYRPQPPRRGAKNRYLLSHFILKMIVLRRQARDKRKESTQKRDALFAGQHRLRLRDPLSRERIPRGAWDRGVLCARDVARAQRDQHATVPAPGKQQMISLAIRMATSFNLPNQAPNFLQFAPAFGSIDDDIYIIIINIYIYIIYIYTLLLPRAGTLR